MALPVLVVLVVDDSPAFRANILEGDVLVAINNEQIRTPSDFLRRLFVFAGTKCTITVIRDGDEQEVPVTLNRVEKEVKLDRP